MYNYLNVCSGFGQRTIAFSSCQLVSPKQLHLDFEIWLVWFSKSNHLHSFTHGLPYIYIYLWLNISNFARYHAYPSPWQVFMQVGLVNRRIRMDVVPSVTQVPSILQYIYIYMYTCIVHIHSIWYFIWFPTCCFMCEWPLTMFQFN